MGQSKTIPDGILRRQFQSPFGASVATVIVKIRIFMKVALAALLVKRGQP